MSTSRASLIGIAVPILLAAACSPSDDPSPDGGGHDGRVSLDGQRPDKVADQTVGAAVKLSLATFNVHNFFDSSPDPDKNDDVYSSTEVTRKIANLGKALRALDADVVALQEVENLALIQRLVKDELQGEGYVEVRLLEGNDPRGIDVAVLSRFAIVRLTSHRGDNFTGAEPGDTERYWFSRDCLEALLEPSPGRKLTLLINHLRASDWKEPEIADRVRLAQAKRVREIVDGTLRWEPDANVAVMGDLNDTPESGTLTILRTGAQKLVDVLEGLSSSDRYTFGTGSKKKQLDYILSSPGLAADLDSAEVQRLAVHSNASDHFPVKAHFTLR